MKKTISKSIKVSIAFCFFLSLMAFIQTVFSQSVKTVFTDWASTTGSQNFFYKNVTKTDVSGNVYIVGATMNGNNNYDILTAKYNSSGVLQWIQQYNGSANGQDIGAGLYVDASGNVYITGTVTTSSTNADIITIKYNSSGTQQWLSTYNGTGGTYDSGADVTVDGSGNVYITGSSYNSSAYTDMMTIKYNSSGTQQWATRWDYTAHLNEAGVKIGINGANGNIVVSGVVQSNTTTYLYGIITFNASTGAKIGTTVSGSSSTGIDQVNDMVIDPNGDIYIAGASPVTGHGYDYTIIKLNSNLGIAWEHSYNGSNNLDDIAKGIKVDASGNVYATGYSTTSSEGKNIVTIKFNSSGTQQWVETFNDSLDGDDEASAMAIDNSGNIYVSGYMFTQIDSADYYTMKYDASGNVIWTIHNDGAKHLNDKVTNITIDNNQDIVVTGESETAPGEFEYYTVKYVEKGIITPTDYNGETPNSSFLYYKNSGQIIDTDTNLVPDIKYYIKNSSPEFYVKHNSYSFVFAKVDSIASTPDTLHRIDVTFEKGNTNAKTYSLEETKNYMNYFLAHCSEGITEIRGNQRLITTDLYPNIDLMYSSNQNGIKYYFIVKPGGDPTDIEMKYTGASSFNLDGTTNALTIYSSIGSITYERPTVYQLETNNTVDTITGWTADWQTGSSSNFYKFNIGSYNNTKALIIQVDLGHTQQQQQQANGNLDWSTYVGGNTGGNGNGDDIGYDVKVDDDGNVFMTGFTSSTNFPYTTGSLTQANFSGYYDAFVSKFDFQSQFLWSTYYGGSEEERGLSIMIGQDKNIYFAGLTKSINFPTADHTTTTPYGQHYFGGETDGFLVSLSSSNGSLRWATYYGGYTRDVIHKVTEDNLGNIIICGSVAEKDLSYTNIIVAGNPLCDAPALNAGFPSCASVSPAYYKNTHSGGTFDAFIAKFDADRKLTWSTFFGGSGSDLAWDVITDPNDNSMYITGFTESTVTGNNTTTSPCNTPTDNGFPVCDLGGGAYYQNVYPGTNTKSYIAKFNVQNQLVWSTFFGGSGDGNVGHHLALNSQGDLYLVGKANTTSSIDIPDIYCGVPTNGGFPLCNPGNSAYYRDNDNVDVSNDITITKFTPSKQIQWSTFFGGSGDEDGYFQEDGTINIAIDNSDRVFLIGNSSKVSGTNGDLFIKPYPNSISPTFYNQPTNVGGGTTRDAFVACFNSNNQPLWSTYFGGGGNGVYASDLGHGLAIDNINKKLYITGGTVSTTFPPACPSAPNPYCVSTLHDAGQGIYDAYIARFNLNFTDGINENIVNYYNLLLFPNPTSSNVTVSLNLTSNEDIEIKLFNPIGQLIKDDVLKNQSGEISHEVDLKTLSSGIYLINVAIGNKTVSYKVIKY